jgi:DNA-binding LacI/PurR family transcriptional regulator
VEYVLMTPQQRVSMQDIARIAKVSPDQVRKVMLGHPDVLPDVRSRVLQIMERAESGQLPGEQAASIGTIGIVLPVAMVSDYIGDVARGASAAAESQNYATVINVQGPERQDDLLELVGDNGCDGLVVVVPHNYDELVALCHQYRRPYVLVDYEGDDETLDVPSVEVNNDAGIIQVMNHLFNFGHSRIGFVTGRMVHASARQRLDAYRRELEKAGIPFDPDLVVEGDWTHPTAYAVAPQLLDRPDRPTAVVCSNDLSAFGVIQAANERGILIGKQLSVTGFDDIDMAATVSPPLTTVSQPGHLLGKVAVEMLIRRLKGLPVEMLHRQLDTRLVIRQSTGPVET